MALTAAVTAIAYHLPETVVSNEEIARHFEVWTPEKIFRKTGIRERRIAAENETAMDLGLIAARKLLEQASVDPATVDLLILCTQTPDYALPTSSCIMQDRLGLPTTCAAFDFNLGCSGYVYGLSMVKSMLEGGQGRRAILVTAETYSKWMDPADRSVLTLFGDGAAATLVELVESDAPAIGPFVYGTDGSGFKKLIVHGSGARQLDDDARKSVPADRNADRLYMDGREIFNFTMQTVPATVTALLTKIGRGMDAVDLWVFHQANAFMLEHLRKELKIPKPRFVMDMEKCGNTVSSTIPIALCDAADKGQLAPGMTVAMVGFGVGYSWAAGLLRWGIG